MQPSRNLFIRMIGGKLAAVTMLGQESPPFTVPGKRPMIVHNEFPEDLETPPEALTTWLTPNDAFFVRQHLPRPKVDANAWVLHVGGMAGKELRMSIADLRKMRQHTVPATLECTGNGRSGFSPIVAGLQWKKGGIGNAEWSGVRLSDILTAAGVNAGAEHVHVDGADVGVAKTPDFIRSIPLRKANDPSTLIALDMNGVPLPEIHGGPLRLIVPGWNGANWVKWVNKIDVAPQPHAGFYMAAAYKYPKQSLPPGVAATPEDLATLERMPVKSFFALPAHGSKHGKGTIALQGVAWSGERKIVRVDVSVDRGITWKPAMLGKEDFASSWRLFRYDWTPTSAGYHVLMCRATDSAGETQPLDAAWNPSGYLWNSLDRVGVTVAL